MVIYFERRHSCALSSCCQKTCPLPRRRSPRQRLNPGTQKIPPDQLDSLVAPIALYPDPLLAQVLAASTYPLEIVQLQQWLTKHKDLKDKALADAVQKGELGSQHPGHGGPAGRGQAVGGQHQVDVELGNAFLAQQSDVMDAVQRMRAKAKDGGKLQSNEQMKVETKVVESKSVVVIEQANPQVVYVPSYDPVVVWGAAPVYAYPPVVYPRGLLRGRNGDFVRSWNGHGSHVERRLGLRCRMGRQQQHQHQQQQ